MVDTASRTNQASPSGVWGAVLLPVDSFGEIDWGALAEEVDILCASELDGIYTNGTAAEFYNQTDSEFDRLSALVAERATSLGKPFQLGVSSTNPRVAQHRLLRAESLAPTGIQFTLPDWWPPSQAEIDNFVVGMQDAASDVPLILYNPPHAKINLTLTEITRLRTLAPNLVGAKLVGGNAAWYAERRALLPDFSIFVPGHTLAFGRPLGANGSYSNVACLSPNGAARHWRLMATDPAAAVELETRITRFMATHILPLVTDRGLSNTALDKLMAAAGGWGPVSSRLLWPYDSATQEDVRRVAKAAQRDLPELFTP